jgi:hypothetical protein
MTERSIETHSPQIQKPRSVRVDADVRAFLDRYADALTSGDLKALAEMWGTPSLVVSDNGVHLVSSKSEIEDFFRGAKDQYNARGIKDTRADVVRAEWVSDRVVMLDVRWPYIDAKGKEIGVEGSVYTLHRDNDRKLKIVAIMMRGQLG